MQYNKNKTVNENLALNGLTKIKTKGVKGGLGSHDILKDKFVIFTGNAWRVMDFIKDVSEAQYIFIEAKENSISYHKNHEDAWATYKQSKEKIKGVFKLLNGWRAGSINISAGSFNGERELLLNYLQKSGYKHQVI